MANFRTRYSAVNDTPGYLITQPSMTVQSDVPGTLIPNIIEQHIPQHSNPPMYGDFVALPEDLAEAYAIVESAEGRFAELPSAVRDRFNNDPAQLMAFLSDANNRAEAEQLGLVSKSVTPPKGGADSVSDPPATPNT